MKMVTALFALSLSATAVFAQKGVEDGSRFGHGQDSLNCLKNISVYTEYVKTNNFMMHTLHGRLYSMKHLGLRLLLTLMVPRFFVVLS